jgi:hypothetical protein
MFKSVFPVAGPSNGRDPSSPFYRYRGPYTFRYLLSPYLHIPLKRYIPLLSLIISAATVSVIVIRF